MAYYSADAENALASYVNEKIRKLQKGYTSRDGGTPESRARLARLRRGLDGTEPSWMMIGDELFTGWPDALPEPDIAGREILAAKSALELYALHQQSRREGASQQGVTDPKERMTFGRACRLIEPDPEKDNAVRKRLQTIENAPDFNGAVRGIRSLIMLMRRSGRMIALDYYTLTRDLYRMQYPDRRKGVFERWSQDFFSRALTSDDRD